MNLPVVHDKQLLRRELRRRRMAVSRVERGRAALAVLRHASRLLGRGKRIGGYLAAGSELDLEPLMSAALFRGASLFLPRIPHRGRRLWFSRIGAADRWFSHPRYGITEYDGMLARAENLDLLFVPLLGIDDEGFRMGQGGGFYDATLAYRRRRAGGPLLVGVAYECQRVAQVPRESWDVRLDALLTEAGLYRLTAQGWQRWYGS
ncbi:5-formyltetrahydrofolate cyclo-ligase [Craterilacuibacter sinensis]|uniref:5-formyltetrahydrofolate cyclo-ligase n=1 Tax=Craterilacuibacter sinensis TaxID=2686017 RepID=A0A845BM85_9NEIS|nr:5-formyltetrahydrofolate cyclo-ligase [Craterilacuibacter sinensis]MXR36384.1 5-formyltetrahydrofolate cyclo-ligase [Craterilacuibacter sinensis]